MYTKQYETMMVNILQRLINEAEHLDAEVLKDRFDNHPESKLSAFHIFIKRCKGHINLITSPEWETLDASEQETIVKYAKKDTCTLEELVRKDIMLEDVDTLGLEELRFRAREKVHELFGLSQYTKLWKLWINRPVDQSADQNKRSTAAGFIRWIESGADITAIGYTGKKNKTKSSKKTINSLDDVGTKDFMNYYDDCSLKDQLGEYYEECEDYEDYEHREDL